MPRRPERLEVSRALIGALVPSSGVKQRSNIASGEFPDQVDKFPDGSS